MRDEQFIWLDTNKILPSLEKFEFTLKTVVNRTT